MTTSRPPAGKKSPEIDINQGHFPDEINTNSHNRSDIKIVNGKKTHPSSSKSFTPPRRSIQLRPRLPHRRSQVNREGAGLLLQRQGAPPREKRILPQPRPRLAQPRHHRLGRPDHRCHRRHLHGSRLRADLSGEVTIDRHAALRGERAKTGPGPSCAISKI